MTESTSEYKKRIEEIKQSIENEPYMAKMREDIAEGISKTGIRQATVEEQFQSVLDETTGKDVISAPELIAARNGELNLKTRLDKEKQEVTAQLAQTEKKAVSTVSHNLDTKTIVSFQDDDGNKKVMSILKPIFEAEGVPATVGIITNRLTQSDSVTKEDLKVLKDLNWTVCSHTHTHPRLGNLTEAENEYEIKTSKNILNSLGMDGDIIIYPYGSHSGTTDRVARRHTVLGVGGYNLYNTMPLITYGLNRFTHISENTFDLAACKAVIDSAPNNSWIVFYTHVNYDMWLLPENVQKLRELIQYIKAKGIDIVNTREGLNRKGNILDAGERSGKRVKVGRDGSFELVTFDRKDFTAATPVTFFPEGESTVYLNSNEMAGKGFPVTAASLIRTYRSPSTDPTKEVSSFQELKPYVSNEVRRRRWLTDTSTWGPFEKIQQNIDNYPMHRVIPTRNPYSASTPITGFPANAITTHYYDTDNNTGMPVPAGVVTTYRFAGNGWDRQEVRQYNGDAIWVRKVNTDGTWGEFVEFSIDPSVWVGSIDVNTAFKALGKAKVKNFIYFDKIHSTGVTQPTLVKEVWHASEISTDSESPSTIATFNAINLVAYKDANGTVYVKNGASGNNYKMFFKVSYC